MHVYALLWVVFGGIYGIEHIKGGGGLLLCKIDGVTLEVARHNFVKLTM